MGKGSNIDKLYEIAVKASDNWIEIAEKLEQDQTWLDKSAKIALSEKEQQSTLYNSVNENEPTDYLVSVSNECENRLNNLMEQFKKSDKLLSEKSKEINQLEWVKLMNNYKIIAEEIILNELIYNKNV